MKPAVSLSMTHPFSAGALCSTVRDLVIWQRALAGGRVVSAQSYSLMTTPDTLNNGSRLELWIRSRSGAARRQAIVSHSGGINGFTTYGMYLPDERLNIIVLTNSDGGPGPLALNVARAVVGIPLVPMPKPLVAVALADSLRDRIPGVYDFGRLVIHVTIEDGRVIAQAEGPGQGKFPLVHVGNLRFGSPADPTLFITFVNEYGKIAKAQFVQRGSPPAEGTRKP